MSPSSWRGPAWLVFAALAGGVCGVNAQTHYIYADVVGVENLSLSNQDCESSRSRGHGNPVTALVGGLLGGLLGNQFGGGSGRAALTVAGAMAGAAFARRPRSDECVPTHAYRVWYRYHGQQFSRRTAEYPGERVLVAVDVEPAFQ